MKKTISVLFALIFTFMLVACGETVNEFTDEEVLSNGGIAATQGEWTYFINGSMPEKVTDALSTAHARGKIYRINSDGSICEKVSDRKAYKLYIYKDNIFYTSPSNVKVDLCMIGVDGKNDKTLFSSDDGQFVEFGKNGVAIAQDKKIFYFDYETQTEKSFDTGEVTGISISDNYIYYFYHAEEGTKRINIEKGNIETLIDGVGEFLYTTDEIAYISLIRVPLKINTNTLETVKISTSLYQNMLLNIKNECIVAVPSDTDDTGLYRQPLTSVAGAKDGEKRLKIHQREISAYCLSDEYVFFVEKESGNIYRMTYSGTDKTILGNMKSVFDVDSIDASGNRLFLFGDGETGLCYYVNIDASGELQLAVKEG